MHGVGSYWAEGGGGGITARAADRARIDAVDLLRGMVIMLMVLDHVRDYFHVEAFLFSAVDADRSYPALFATRWITHLCAPVFVLLAGVSAQLQLQVGKPIGQVRGLLWTRGLWLIALELTVVSFGFNFGVPVPFLQVIWAIGWSMIALAAVAALPVGAVAAIGGVILLGHNLLDPIAPADLGDAALAWQFLHEGGPIMIAGQPVGLIAYPVLPWIGVMCLGFAAGRAFTVDQPRRRRLFTAVGAAMLAAFLLLRAANGFGDPDPWVARDDPARSVMAFLDVEKYPPSLLYVLATIGVALILTPLVERLPRIGRALLLTFGQVPLFAYLVHLYVVHGLVLLTLAAAGRDPIVGTNFMIRVFTDPQSLAGWGYGLPGVLATWLVALAILYPLCRWFGAMKRRRRDWWLSYF